jgi:hypothetical protein
MTPAALGGRGESAGVERGTGIGQWHPPEGLER